MKQTTEPLRTHFADCAVCAYHESGHILFAYLCGYRCRYAELISENNEEGYSSIAILDFGNDEPYAARLGADRVELDSFRCLSLGEKLQTLETGRRLARIWLAGSVAAAVYNNGGNAHIPLPLQIDYLDLRRVEAIQGVLQELSNENEEGFIEHGLQEALYTLANGNIWNTLADLANRLLERKTLDGNDIEECLEEHGISYDGAWPAETVPLD